MMESICWIRAYLKSLRIWWQSCRRIEVGDQGLKGLDACTITGDMWILGSYCWTYEIFTGSGFGSPHELRIAVKPSFARGQKYAREYWLHDASSDVDQWLCRNGQHYSVLLRHGPLDLFERVFAVNPDDAKLRAVRQARRKYRLLLSSPEAADVQGVRTV